ncbi:hypothetical protein P1J78_17870 [Psychromarinibacter sp. C21-152]|uniref:Uncharacterized protein n=1 Tax=Psychromarinibacter sediminicola TaxID=3033385 RepID=A0AAE3NX77_9RHOB|nr:hypothetical protein [Psychromarinibacter sediminicola]MDF0602610.1 hypothetical protein [Psychromarinibacter sediminicola]
MANDWILDVLADLRAFARKNGLSQTAEQLDDATLIAAVELASEKGRAPDRPAKHAGTAGLAY